MTAPLYRSSDEPMSIIEALLASRLSGVQKKAGKSQSPEQLKRN
jgi:hypothetical protein